MTSFGKKRGQSPPKISNINKINIKIENPQPKPKKKSKKGKKKTRAQAAPNPFLIDPMSVFRGGNSTTVAPSFNVTIPPGGGGGGGGDSFNAFMKGFEFGETRTNADISKLSAELDLKYAQQNEKLEELMNRLIIQETAKPKASSVYQGASSAFGAFSQTVDQPPAQSEGSFAPPVDPNVDVPMESESVTEGWDQRSLKSEPIQVVPPPQEPPAISVDSSSATRIKSDSQGSSGFSFKGPASSSLPTISTADFFSYDEPSESASRSEARSNTTVGQTVLQSTPDFSDSSGEAGGDPIEVFQEVSESSVVQQPKKKQKVKKEESISVSNKPIMISGAPLPQSVYDGTLSLQDHFSQVIQEQSKNTAAETQYKVKKDAVMKRLDQMGISYNPLMGIKKLRSLLNMPY